MELPRDPDRRPPRRRACWPLLVLLSACGGDPGAPPGRGGAPAAYVRIDLDDGRGAAPRAEVLAEFVADLDRPPWETVAHGGTEHREVEGRAVTVLMGRGARKIVKLPLDEGSARFNLVVVEAAARGGQVEILELAPMLGGKPMVPTKLAELEVAAGLQAVSIPVPELRTLERRPEALWLGFEGAAEEALLARVTLLRRPVTASLTPPEGLGRPALVGGVYRRAEHLTSGAPARGGLELREGHGVELYVAADELHRRPGEELLFRARLTSGGASAERVARPAVDRWERLRFEPGEVPAGDATLTVSLESSVGEGVGVGLVAEAAARGPGDGSRTVLLISSDTHRADHLGVASADSPVATPHLDALAARGVHFTNCYSSTNVTNPSHIALMTGVHPRDTTIVNNRTRLSDQAVTIAERFAAAGYQTFAATSAFHLLDRHSGLGQGFDRMEGPVRDQRDGEVAVAQLLQWIEEADGAPVFAWLHLFDAHDPYGPPEPYDRRYWDGGDPFEGPDPGIDAKLIPEYMKGLKALDFPYAQYRAEVDYLDGALRDLLEHPRMGGAAIAFTADHGEAFGEHGIWWSHAGLYPHSIHVPLLLSGPGATPGSTHDGPVRQIDVSHTLLAMAGLETDGFPGVDLRAVQAGEATTDPRFGLGSHDFEASIQAGKWLLILDLRPHWERALERMRFTGQCELYDLEADPACEDDLLLEEFETAARLRAALIRWLGDQEGPGFAETQRRSREEEAMLRALGYGGGQSRAGTRWWDPERWSRRPWAENPWNLLFSDPGFPKQTFRAAAAAWAGG